jgi:RNA polymerase sigma-70 factor (ECF subfamily)
MSEPGTPLLALVSPDRGEAALLARVLARSPTAARELFDTFAPRIRRLVLRLGLNAADAEDIVQESLLIAWNRAHRVTRAAELQGFVLAIAINHARSLMRRRRWARALGLEPADTAHFDPDVASASSPESVHELRRVFKVLDGLSDELRLAFVLRFVEQLTLEEATLAAGWSLATMKRKLERARTLFVARARQDPLLWDRLSKEERDA